MSVTIKPKKVPGQVVIGTIRYAEDAAGEYGPQIALKGMWDGFGEGKMWLPIQVREQLAAIGAIGPNPDAQGNYTVIGQPRVRVDATQQKYVVTADASSQPAAEPHRQVMKDAPAGSTAPAAAAVGGQAPGVVFGQLKETMRAAVNFAKDLWEIGKVEEAADIAAARIAAAHSTAASLFIAAERRGCLAPPPARKTADGKEVPPPPPITDSQLERLVELAQQLRFDDESLGREIQQRYQGLTDPRKLTADQALLFIKTLELKVFEQQALANQREQQDIPF